MLKEGKTKSNTKPDIGGDLKASAPQPSRYVPKDLANSKVIDGLFDYFTYLSKIKKDKLIVDGERQ